MSIQHTDCRYSAYVSTEYKEIKIIFDDDIEISKIIIEHQWVYIKLRYLRIFIIKTFISFVLG